jgi:hypothetical protein
MTAKDTMTAKKKQAEKLLAQKIALRNSTAETLTSLENNGLAGDFSYAMLKANLEQYDLEMEALQAFIEGIDLELTKRG